VMIFVASVIFLIMVETIDAFSMMRKILNPNPRTSTRSKTDGHAKLRSLPSLYSSPLEDPEEDPELDETVMVSKEPFESEADVAEKANAMLSREGDGNISNIELQTELETSFLQYAMSIILGRALPDIRDGLKPVHRRILFAMDQLNLDPKSSHRKCARVVGEVLGKYHPHGDLSVYDALVRMAQDFSTAYQLVDGHGNFGSIDADPAAAMRYTECRLTEMAKETLLEELDLSTVDFSPNFDGNENEPNVLPSKLPLLLLNGSSGIAVGMATNIPPHNLREIVNALKAVIKKERLAPRSNEVKKGTVSDDELFEMVPGPDFPTRATIIGTENARKLYTTGRGSVTMRAVTHMEELSSPSSSSSKKMNRKAIVVTELPYQVNKAALLEHIANLVNNKKLDGISDLRDESDRDGIRIVVELKMRDTNPSMVLANLYQKTKLQTNFAGNLLALMKPNSGMNDKDSGISVEDDKGDSGSLTPQRFTLREALDQFLNFRFETIRRKTVHQLKKVQSRMHIVDGLLQTMEHIDVVIDLIRNMPDQASCRSALMQSKATKEAPLALGLSKEQADSVLKLQLGQLTRLSQGKLTEERTDLESKRKDFQKLLDDDDAVYNVMTSELDKMAKKFGHDRKSKILEEENEDDLKLELIKNSRSVIVVTREGYIKRMELTNFANKSRGSKGSRASSIDDEILHCITCNDHDTLLMITQDGKSYGLRAYQVPMASRTAKGAPLPSVLPISIGQELTTLLAINEFTDDEYLLLGTTGGRIKKTAVKLFEKITKKGLLAAELNDGDELEWCHKCTNDDDVLICSSRGLASRFKISELRPTGRISKGVLAMRIKPGDTIADIDVLRGSDGRDRQHFVLCMSEQGYGKRVLTDQFKVRMRNTVGVKAFRFKGKKAEEDKVSCFCVVNEDDEILIITSKGRMVRQRVDSIPCYRREAGGVVVQKLNDSDKITSINLVPTRAQE